MSHEVDPDLRERVRFVLNGEVVEIDGVDPQRTLLQYLREDLGCTGTKEGCAEGDCGACTVVVARPDAAGERLVPRAINACIRFLPTVDGHAVFTAEGLAANGLHPVQQALVDGHGSQCGFCTPGIVMSLFALYKTHPSPGRRDIDEALAGNLCRCTGYEPIVAAARAMYDVTPAVDDWTTRPTGRDAGSDEAGRLRQLADTECGRSVGFRAGPRRYFAPRTMDELAALAADHPDATLVAGGTDVGLWVTKQHRDLGTIIHTGRVAGMTAVTVGETALHIGAAAVLSDVVPLLCDHYPGLAELFARFASPPIRNAATLGGNIANGSPIGDSMPALLVLGAELLLRRGEGQRTLPLGDFYPAFRQTALERGEFIEAIRVPLHRPDEYVAAYKVSKRFDQDISAVCGAYRLVVDQGRVEEVRIAYGGMAATVRRAPQAESRLLHERWDDASVQRAMAALDLDFEPIGDLRASAAYRRSVAKNLLRRFFRETRGDAVSVYRYGR